MNRAYDKASLNTLRDKYVFQDELAALLAKVKEVISENEGLYEKEKAGLLKSVFDYFETGDEDDQEMESEGKVGI